MNSKQLCRILFLIQMFYFQSMVVMLFKNIEINEICPSYQTLYPCFCNLMPKYDEGANIDCSENSIMTDHCHSSVITCIGNGMTNLRQILNSVAQDNQNQIIRTFEWFYLVDPELNLLENNLFENVHFKNIYLQNCPNLKYIDENAFGSESRMFIKNIYINALALSDQTKMKRKTFKALSSLKNLNVLEIQNNNLSTIPYKAFNKFTDVKIVRFYNPDIRGKIKKIHSKAFYKATKLVEIDLKNNQIYHISAYAFHFQLPSNHELKIYLSGNSLHSNSFEPKAFNGGNGRKMILYLGDYNNCNLKLKTLKQNVFEPFLIENKENIIDLYGCPIVCDHEMDWLLNNVNRFKNQIRNLICFNHTNLIKTDNYEYYHVTQ